MNAKLAVAISLGASSLALFGMANVANAATTSTTATNTPITSITNESQSEVEKIKKDATEIINAADSISKEANTAANEANGVDSEAKKAEKENNEANTEANNAKQNKIQCETNLKTANELKAETAEKSREKQNDIDKTNVELSRVEEKKNKAEEEKNKAEEEKQKAEKENSEANSNVRENQSELDKAQSDFDTYTSSHNEEKQLKSNVENELSSAKNSQKTLQTEYNQSVEAANAAEKAKSLANDALEKNKQEKIDTQNKITNIKNSTPNIDYEKIEELQKKINKTNDNLNNTKSELESTNAYVSQQKSILASKTEEFNTAKLNCDNNGYCSRLIKAEEELEKAKINAKKANDAYNAADSTYDANAEISKRSDFYKFLQYVIDIENRKGENKNDALIKDAEYAQSILKGEKYTVPKRVLSDGRYFDAYDVQSPTWYKDVVAKGLGRIGSADSLENMKEAVTYYDLLNKLRNEDSPTLSATGVKLRLIAESIVHSFYSAALYGEHAGLRKIYKNSEVMNTNPYAANENLAWGSYDGDNENRYKIKDNECNIDENGMTHCTISPDVTVSALNAWYTVEKHRYDKAINEGIFLTYSGDKQIIHKLAPDAKTILKNHRYDILSYLRKNKLQLFEEANINEHLTYLFIEATGHYLNFAQSNIKSSGFSEGDIYIPYPTWTSEDVAVWHGNRDTGITVNEYKDLLNGYVNTVKKQDTKKDVIEQLQKLNGLANKANMDLFEARYNLRKVQYDLNLPADDSEKTGLQDQEVSLKQSAVNAADKELKRNENNKRVAEDYVKRYEENPNADWNVGPKKAKEDYLRDKKILETVDEDIKYAKSILDKNQKKLQSAIKSRNAAKEEYEKVKSIKDVFTKVGNEKAIAEINYNNAVENAKTVKSEFEKLSKEYEETNKTLKKKQKLILKNIMKKKLKRFNSSLIN